MDFDYFQIIEVYLMNNLVLMFKFLFQKLKTLFNINKKKKTIKISINNLKIVQIKQKIFRLCLENYSISTQWVKAFKLSYKFQ